ncbi:MAG: hypothetical protein H6817_05215 [Phycisphaerales bacterium]|nr:hypothetical protein [Phycisphaerales bacterium]
MKFPVGGAIVAATVLLIAGEARRNPAYCQARVGDVTKVRVNASARWWASGLVTGLSRTGDGDNLPSMRPLAAA